MAFDLKELVSRRKGENYRLHEQHLNRTLAKVLRTIGFDKVYARAKGAFLFDQDGNPYLDFLSGYGVFGVGRNHPVVAQALRDVLDLDLPNMVQMDCALLSGLLAEALVARTGGGRDAVFFCNSGTEAVEGALKFARAWTGRRRILSLDHAYHGLTFGSLSVTQSAQFQEGFGPLLDGVERVPMNDLDALAKALSGGDVAAFIAEPVQGKGVWVPDAGYLPAAQDLCRKHKTAFICDEVQTGLGRTGRFFGYEHWGLDPDIITVAKTLSGGYVPVGAFITRRAIHQAVFSRMDRCVVHSTTFGRNNLAMAAGLATLSVLDEEALVENAARQGEALISGLRALQDRHEVIGEVRGLGLMVAVQFREPKSFKMRLGWKTLHAVDRNLFTQMIVTSLMKRHRILTHVAGHNLDALKILPPLIVGEPEIRQFLTAFDDVLSEVGNASGPIWDFGKTLAAAALRKSEV